MIVRAPSDVVDLPRGSIQFEKDGVLLEVKLQDDYAVAAAQFILQVDDRRNFDSQADLIAYAMKTFQWGLARNGYTANFP